MKGEEVLRNESIKEAHDASKASIQSRISNLESGGVKGTGESGISPRYGERKITDEEYEAKH
ncbi:hypothetical protein [Bacillus wiedmannii]|uniref:hypothetical protein n=1 Tax=Bacillus wiedmannii TaxID=1890302 RepID=UPI00352B3C9A